MMLNFSRSSYVRLLGLATALLCLSVGGANIASANESLDKMIASAMENHPDIVAAKAKVTLAEAELDATRLRVARQVIDLWGNQSLYSASISNSKRMMAENKGAVKTPAFLQNLQESQVKLEQANAEIKFLTEKSSQSPDGEPNNTPGNEIKAAEPPPRTPIAPSGQVVEKLRKMLTTDSTELDFSDTPLEQVVTYLSENHIVTFLLDKNTLSDAGIASDMPITMNIKGVPIVAALQAFEDHLQGVQFVVRDYGILLTTIDHAKAQGYVPVLEFVRDISKEKAVFSPTPQNPQPVEPVVVPLTTPPGR
jgi:hypothetical protein